MIVDNEAKAVKNRILISGICVGVISLIFCALYLARLDTVVRVQSDAEEMNPSLDRNAYDQCPCATYLDSDGRPVRCEYTD